VFDGKTMFSFMFDFSKLGDPSMLSEQANLNCWADGTDDAGWALSSSTGNSELDPWLEAPLNNIGPDLGLENVELSGTFEAGEKIRLSFFVINGGEQLPTPFNATIELIQGEERTLVGRSVFYSMDANTAKSVKRSFTAPEGAWTLEITVDQEGLVWEIDETNNIWNRTVQDESGGLGGLTIMLGGGAMFALVGAAVLLQRRGTGTVEEEKVVVALKATGQEPQSTRASSPTQQPAQKRRGPPGGKIASNSGKKPTRGPPRSPPKSPSTNSEPSPQEMAAKHMAALGVPETAEERVEGYAQLPGGGEYEYTAEATFYVGETCGRWRLNEDKSFTRIPDDS
jgi:hypothetical protein